jgi:hypothetical protein
MDVQPFAIQVPEEPNEMLTVSAVKTNEAPIWAAVLIGYTFTAFVLTKLKAEWQIGKWSPKG